RSVGPLLDIARGPSRWGPTQKLLGSSTSESRLRDLKDRLMVIPEAEMHELAIAESIVQAVQSRIGDRPGRSVHLQVGQLSGVLTDALTCALELAASGTPLEGAELLIYVRP